MWIAEEESFGPIMIISKFPHGDVEGVIERANDTEFGLASGVFTKVGLDGWLAGWLLGMDGGGFGV